MNRTIGVVTLASILVFAGSAAAQQKAVGLTIRGGSFAGLTSLDEPGTADFKQVGYNIGGSVGVDLSRYVGLRGDFTFARNELQLNEQRTGSNLNRYFYDAAVQLQYPTGTGWTPYAFAGAGAVTLDPEGSAVDSRTKAAGTGGIGLSYAIPGSNVAVGLEGKGWLFGVSELDGDFAGYDRRQFEVTWGIGISYRIPYGSAM
jgi:opacity protein-like surface antigen